jgi:hypothetical protein
MKGSSSQARHLVKVSICGLMEKFTMESGEMESKRAMEYGRGFLETHTLESGRIQRQMVMVFISGRMEINMRASGEIV